MGLDQNAYAISKAEAALLDSQEYLDGELAIESEESLMYWRKHADLNQWMTDLYEKKGGKGSFNGQNLFLEQQDLLDLEDAVIEDALPHGEGFFWGESQPEDKGRTLGFIEAALKAIKEGKAVFYNCSW